MIVLVLGLVIFLGVHLVPTSVAGRSGLVGRLGENGYKIGFSVASLIGFVMLVWGMGLARGSASDPQLWHPPVWTRHLAFALMLPAFILLVAAYVPSRIRDMAKHPMLAAVKIWALAHLLSNGDLAGLLLFGGFLAWAVADRISMKQRVQRPLPGAPAGRFNDLIAVLAGLALYALFITVGHRWLIGVAPF